MNLSIIINHYKTPDILKLCLKYLFKNLPKELETEIFLTDGEADPKNKEIIKKYPKIKYIPFEKNVGFSKLVNEALKQVKGDFIFIINADIIIHKKNSLTEMIKYLKENPEAGLAGPKLFNIDGSFQQSCFKYYTPLTIPCRRTFLKKTPLCKKTLNKFLMKKINLKQREKPLEVDWLMGSALLTKKEALKKVGFFDDRFFMYFEDVDWCKRFWQNGYKVIWLPGSLMYHYHFRASKGKSLIKTIFNKYTRIHILSALRYFKKHGFGK